MSVKQNTKKKYYFLHFFVAFFLIGSFLFLLPSVAHADVGEAIVKGLGTVLNGFLYAIFIALGWLVSVAITLFEWVIDPKYYSEFLNLPATYEMWQFIRDFFNLFFILILLYIAFTVVFQIQHDFKKTLLSLVLAALFVNFSFPVSRALIDATNVPMYFFVNQMTVSPTGGHLGSVLTSSGLENILIPPQTDFEDLKVSQMIMAIVFMFIFGVTLLVLALMFAVRLVALTILVIFSSIGFAASVVPGLEQYSSKWWDYFWKYTIFGPAAMLMILIATRFFGALAQTQSNMKMTAGGLTAGNDMSTFVGSMAMFSIPIMMLWMAMGLANEMSIAGASSVVGWGEKVSKWVGKQTLSPIPWAGRKWEKAMTTGKHSKFTKYLAPTAVYKGWEEWRHHAHEKDRMPVEQAAFGVADDLSHLPLQDRTDLAFKNYAANISKEQKEINAISGNSDYVIHELIDAINAGDNEKTIGALQILASNNDLNDMMHAMKLIEGGTGKKFGKNGKESAGTSMSSESAKEALKQMMLQSGAPEDLAAKAMLNLSNTAIAAGNVGMAGSAGYNKKNHAFEITDEETQASVAAAKLQNLETQARQRTLHHNAIFKEEDKIRYDEHGNPTETIEMEIDGEMKHVPVAHYGGINNKVGKAVLGTITIADIAEGHRSRDDLKREVANRMEVIRQGSGGMDLDGNIVREEDVEALRKEIEGAIRDNPNLKGYFNRLYSLNTGKVYESGLAFNDLKQSDKDGKPEKTEKTEKGGAKEPKGPTPPDRSSSPIREYTGPIELA